MERVLSPEERIRKAEDLYYRRKMQSSNRQTARVNVDDKLSFNPLKKIVLQIIGCIVIYIIWYALQNGNYIFFENIKNNIKQILEYDINFSNLYSIIIREEKKEDNIENIQNEPTIETSSTTIEDSLPKNEEIKEPEVAAIMEEASSIDQMREDAEYIKANNQIIKPLSGTITSRFGVRVSSNPKVAGYHTGIDIAVSEGTVFVSAMSGTVELVSTVGDYRKSF